MTNKECFRLNGTLPAERIEKLIGIEEQFDKFEDVSIDIGEAIGQYPDEDCLSSIIKDLNDLCKKLRGDNRAHLQGIICDLEEKESTLIQSAEYGTEKLDDAIEIIDAIIYS
jgi:hypothetical protein